MLELRPDAVIAGRLRLLAPLGQGGMGVVWRARQLSLDAEVAVKFIRPERVAADPTLLARFEREAKAAARIAHPHVVQVTDYGTADAVPYIVMELLRGASLAELLARGGRLSLATAGSLLRQVGGALESAHEQGIVHRDVKPQNVFITEGGRSYPLFVKVLDFGVAKMVGEPHLPGASGALTATGMVIGSPPYMSPEQLEGRSDVDLRSDLWSLAVILYEALTGTQPFQGGSFVAVGAAVLQGRYRPATEHRPELPRFIDDWFAKALCTDPASRFQSSREMVEAFELHHGSVRMGEQDLASGVSADAHVVALATTVKAPAVEPTDAHVPVAEPTDAHEPAAKPMLARAGGAVAGRPRVPWRRRRTTLAAAAFALLVLVGLVGAAARSVRSVRSVGAPGCPVGMVAIEGAAFRMGSAEDAETPTDETPQHRVVVDSFCLDRTEVTVRAYSECRGCGRGFGTVEFEGLTPNGRAFMSQFCHGPEQDTYPINCVDWTQARTYCAEQGKRLPTEQEWELAARGPEGRTYPWGAQDPSGALLNACGSECSRLLTERLAGIGKGPWPAMYPTDDSAPAAAVVGRYAAGATPAGVLDLAGNVWEWTDSVYCPYGKSDCGDSRRVLRGGGWDTTERNDVRAARRYPSAPAARGRSIGFRCAANL